VEAAQEFAQLQLQFVDQLQQRYEVIRPLILFEDRTATQRAQETQLHPETVRTLARRFRQQGMLGLLPADHAVVPQGRARRIPDTVRQEIDRLKGLYAGFHYRELARIVFCKLGESIDHKTVKQLWEQSPVVAQAELALGAYHTPTERYQARLQGVQLYYQGWEKISISRFMHVSRPTVDAWIHRFETEHFAGLVDRSRAPKAPARKVWLPLMIQVYHLQKRHPDAGEFRLWSLLAQSTVSVRTIGRIMAVNKLVYPDIPHVVRPGAKPPPQPHPYKAQRRHQYWFIDGRQMDFALPGGKWWSIVLLEGYSRTIVAGAVAPTEATWVALMVLYTACLRYGVPEALISDSGGAYTSNVFEAVCRRLQIQHETIVSTQGESYKNWMETHFNIQRRIYDYQFSLATTPLEFERVHQAFIQTYNTTAHHGLLQDQRYPPIPLEVLGAAKGRLYLPEDLARQFATMLFPRTTNRYGCVTLHSYHFYVEEGLAHMRILLWVYGEQLRAVFDEVVVAEYHCRYDGSTRKVRDIRDGVVYPTRFLSPQGSLIPLNARETLVVYRPTPLRQRVAPPRSTGIRQLLLFELASAGAS
jgi:transposase InsO family protein